MTHHYRLGNLLTWAIILLAFLWLSLIFVPQFVDRISHHEDNWAKEFGDSVSAKVSDSD